MSDLYETTPDIDDVVSATNEHLIPYGSVVMRNATRVVKHEHGWFPDRNPYTYPVMGYRIESLGDGGLETLDHYKMRVRATVLSRMAHEGVSGSAQVNRALEVMSLYDLGEAVPGMPIAWPMDLQSEGLLSTHVDGIRPGKRFTSGNLVSLVLNVEPINAEDPWVGEQGTWAEWVQVKRALWEHGSRLASDNGWCGTFGNVMSSLGIDGTFTDAVGAVREQPLAELLDF